MADYEQELGLKMWKDTNYPAQVEMMKEAGLNPAAVLSNGGGGSGATGASAAGVGGGGFPHPCRVVHPLRARSFHPCALRDTLTEYESF